MRKLKYIILIIMVLFISGCSGKYNLTFDKNLNLTEELNVYIENENDNYERTYQLLDQAGVSKDKYDVVVEGDKINITYKETYPTFEDYYLDSKLYRMLFEEIEFNKSNTGMDIKAESNLKLDDKNNINIINAYDIDDFDINIKLPFSVKDNNADEVKSGIYTWKLKSSDTFKEINIKFDYKNDNVRSIVLIALVSVVSLGILIYIFVYLSRNQRI
ncbi:MAG: hypothetical protein IKF37_02740 [Bacilli bacterium]|nr:hypothetical protein [Bacilli bacterium]